MSVETTQKALAAVDAALFAYSTVGPRLDAAGKQAAADAHTALRAQRDSLQRMVMRGRATPAAPPPAYDLGPLPDVRSARATALRAEESLAAAFAQLVVEAASDDRASAALWLAGSAVRAVTWRAALGTTPTTVPFPGLSVP
jgi:hypothetical protein